MPIHAQDLVDRAMAQIETIDVSRAKSLLGQEHVQFVDIRDIRELQREGTIPGAYHAPRGMLEFWIDPQSEYAKEVFQENRHFVFFCAAGFRSALATKLADDMGLSKVCHIEGGFSAWRDAGGEIIPLPEKKAR